MRSRAGAFALTRSAAGTTTSPAFHSAERPSGEPTTDWGRPESPQTPVSGSGTCPSPAASHSWPPAWVESSSIRLEPPRRPARWRSGPPGGWPDRTPSLPHPPPCSRRSAQRPRRRWMWRPVTHRPETRGGGTASAAANAASAAPWTRRPRHCAANAHRNTRCPAQRWPASTPPALPG